VSNNVRYTHALPLGKYVQRLQELVERDLARAFGLDFGKGEVDICDGESLAAKGPLAFACQVAITAVLGKMRPVHTCDGAAVHTEVGKGQELLLQFLLCGGAQIAAQVVSLTCIWWSSNHCLKSPLTL
jgi:hypothetical protein